jgi:hypothetical protein
MFFIGVHLLFFSFLDCTGILPANALNLTCGNFLLCSFPAILKAVSIPDHPVFISGNHQKIDDNFANFSSTHTPWLNSLFNGLCYTP